MSRYEIRRGDFFWVNLQPNESHEISKVRPCLVISNNQQNKFSQLITVLPLTSKYENVYPFQVESELAGKKGIILVDQIRTIDKKFFGDKISEASSSLISKIENALHITLALKK